MIKRFYFPLGISVWEREGSFIDWDDYGEGDGEVADRYRVEIERAFFEYAGYEDMAEYFDETYCKTAKSKIQHIEWGFESVNSCLYGRVNVTLSSPLTKDEEGCIKKWICGQNSDGLGECFEQKEIKTDRGVIMVRFWESSNNYRIYNEREFMKHEKII